MIIKSSKSMHEVIYRSLRLKIMYGEFDPGKTFSIRGLATQFSVSMTPIREATRRLVAEGALMMSASGRISVPLVSSIRLKELLSLRLLLEPDLASRAVPKVHLALIERLCDLNDHLEKMIENDNVLGYLRTNIEFHKTLYLRAQAPTMITLLEIIWLQLGPTFKVGCLKSSEILKTTAHHNIISALRIGNQVDLAESVIADINNDFRVFMN